VKQFSYDEAPWFDQPDALEVLAQRHAAGLYTSEQRACFESWVENGYVVLDGLFETSLVEEMLADLDSIWSSDEPMDGLSIAGLGLNPEHPSESPHRLLVEQPFEERCRLRRENRWRVHGFYEHSRAAAAIFNHKGVRDLVSLLLDRPAQPSYTINFEYGSEQTIHQDMGVFSISPPNHLVGLWLACEDVDADSGPLILYPGSHRDRMWEGFPNYPQTSLRTSSPEVSSAYYEYLDTVASRHERREFLPKNGQVLLWHGMLLHGGSIAKNRLATRRSYVCHYVSEGADKMAEIEGPLNW
jgi:phytanoyl-CoA hydroxylase